MHRMKEGKISDTHRKVKIQANRSQVNEACTGQLRGSPRRSSTVLVYYPL